MGPGGALADGELGGDLLVGLPHRDEAEHVELAGRELGDRVGVRARLARRQHQRPRDDGIDLELAPVRGPDRGGHVLGV